MENFIPTRDYVSVFGINHECGDLETRQRFYLTEPEYSRLLLLFKEHGIKNILVLNTCNRTEVYGTRKNLSKSLQLYRKLKGLDNETLHVGLFIKHDREALEHFFKVGAGLNSKILGDYQIIGQIRSAYNDAKHIGLILSLFERLFQVLFKATKAVKSQTGINSGAASHGYVVANTIKEQGLPANSGVLILGAGDMARRTFQHIRDYCNRPITLANRTPEHLTEFKNLEGVATTNLENVSEKISQHRVIVNTVPVTQWLTQPEMNQIEGKLVFDLAVPADFAKALNQSTNRVFGIDQIEQLTQDTVADRAAHIPAATAIIEEHIAEFEAYCRQADQKVKFRNFESDLKAYLNSVSVNDTAQLDPEIFSKKVTQLFMKRFYAENIKADSIGLAG